MTEDKKNEQIAKVINVWNEKNKITFPNYNKDALKIIDQVAHFFSAGSYYYYIFNFSKLEIEFVSDSVEENLGISPKNFNLNSMLSQYHPEDLKKLEEKENAASDFLFKKLSPEDIPFYKVVYVMRLKAKNGEYKKFLHQAKAINVTKDGKIQQVLGVHTDITYLNSPVDHKVSFIGDGRPSYYSLEPSNMVYEEIEEGSLFTKQEINIIEFISSGKSSAEIAQSLHISIETIKTHRKNILSKSGATNAAQLVANCIRDGII